MIDPDDAAYFLTSIVHQGHGAKCARCAVRPTAGRDSVDARLDPDRLRIPPAWKAGDFGKNFYVDIEETVGWKKSSSWIDGRDLSW
jgi:hypothetical protein